MPPSTKTYPGLDALLHRQEGVVSRVQALACGISPDAVRHRIRPGGPWQRLLPGVYLSTTGTPTLRQKEIAALRYAGHGSVLTGRAALRHHEAPGHRRADPGRRVPGGDDITVLVPASRPHKSQAIVTVWPSTHMPDRVCFEGPIQYVLPDRAVADAARECASFDEVRALVAEVVQQNLCRLDLLQQEAAAGPVRRSAWLRRALDDVADGVRSGAEGDFHDLIKAAGLPLPMLNPRLYLGKQFIAVPDAWWPEAGVAGEVDSRQWHLSPADWERTLRRHALMSACGIIVLHFTPGQIRREPASVAAALRAALAAGQRRAQLPLRAVRPAA